MSVPSRLSSCLALLCLAAAPALAQPPALPSDLRAVPGDALGFVHVRLSDVWKLPGFAEYRRVLSMAGPEALALFDSNFAPAPSTIDRITVIYPNAESVRQADVRKEPGSISAVYVLHASKPFDKQAILKVFDANARPEKEEGQSYYALPHNWGALQFLDDQTLLYGSEEAVVLLFAQQAKPSPAHLAALQSAAQANLVTVGLNPAQFPASPQALHGSAARKAAAGQPAEPEQPAAWPEFMQTLLKAKSVQLTLSQGTDLELRMRCDFPDAARAGQGRVALETIRTLLQMQLQTVYAEGFQQLKRNERFMAWREQPKPGPHAVLSSMAEASTQTMMLLGLGALRSFEAQLKAARIEAKETVALFDGRIDTFGNTGMLGMFGAISAIGMSVDRQFAMVGNRVGGEKRGEMAPPEVKEVAAALKKYLAKHGHYPPAARYDAKGQALMSWRVELLPYLGEERLYKEFRLNEPWDSLRNRRVMRQMPFAYQGSSGTSWKTCLQGVSGPGAMFDGPKGIGLKDVKDDANSTVLLVETDGEQAVAWTQPLDVKVAATGQLEDKDHNWSHSFWAIFADGQVRYAANNEPPVLQALFTRQGGERLEADPQSPGRWKLR